jgi:transcriptional regulator with XRE-family HTH domain
MRCVGGTEKGATPRQRLLGERLRARREKLGLRRLDVAQRAGMHRSYIAALEVGLRNPSFENLCRLALALDVDPGELVRGAHLLAGRVGAEDHGSSAVKS